MKVTREQIDERRRTRPAEYWADVAACPGIVLNPDGSADIDPTAECWHQFTAKWKNWRPPEPIKKTEPIKPRSEGRKPCQVCGGKAAALARIAARSAGRTQ